MCKSNMECIPYIHRCKTLDLVGQNPQASQPATEPKRRNTQTAKNEPCVSCLPFPSLPLTRTSPCRPRIACTHACISCPARGSPSKISPSASKISPSASKAWHGEKKKKRRKSEFACMQSATAIAPCCARPAVVVEQAGRRKGGGEVVKRSKIRGSV